MAPERSPKRQKVSTSEEQSQPTELLQPAADKANQRSSWYNSWSRKAPPVIDVARESIRSVSSTPPSETLAPASPRPRSIRSPSLAMALGKKQSNRGVPIDATTTKVNAEASSPGQKNSSTPEPLPDTVQKSKAKDSKPAKATGQSSASLDTRDNESKQDVSKDNSEVNSQRSGWLGWMGKGEDKPAEAMKDQQSHGADPDKTTEVKSDNSPGAQDKASEENQEIATVKRKTVRKSWLPWSVEEVSPVLDDTPATSEDAANSQDAVKAQQSPSTPKKAASKALPIKAQTEFHSDSIASSEDAAPPPSLPHDGSKASAWAFWSRERKANLSNASVDKPHDGEIAISDTPSQRKPKRASISVPKPDKKLTDMSGGTTTNQSSTVEKPPKPPKAKSESSNAKAAVPDVPEQKPSSPNKSIANPANLNQTVLLPELHATLKIPVNPSIIQQLARLLNISREPELKHLSLVRDPPRIRNALAIGVHGYFPAQFIRTVLGQPTGTSIKFADMAAKAVKRWTKSHGYDCEVKTAALEGEGKIAERVDLLWKLLLNWIEEIRKSDFVLIACHSQGVPVAIMLVAKLIQFGCLGHARVGICAMAGVNTGPFPELKSRFLGASAGELFEFSDPASTVSQDYLAALEAVLKFGARITFIGSIDDQLVSLESSIFSSISHPHIYRAVSVDARLHAPTFLSHLVGFALKLRNLGVQDHGLIRELSSPLAGSLYTGDGHSRIYESDDCYDMAVDWALLTTSMAQAPLLQRPPAPGSSNPYILPFAMRGILEEDFVKTDLQGEASELLMQFDEWKPTTKVLKDVKFRLEGIRSKL